MKCLGMEKGAALSALQDVCVKEACVETVLLKNANELLI